ncbi:MAG: lipoprotein insertase outer membrane protein LolB [Pseudomonadales bacterium]
MRLSLRRANWFFFLGFLLLASAACTVLPRPEVAPGEFLLRGKLGVSQGDDSFSARLLWHQRDGRFAMDVWGPLGQGRVRLEGTPAHLTLLDGSGTIITEGPAEAVMQAHLGWSLPLAVLPEWVRGRPASGVAASARDYDADGRLVAFNQLRWRVELDRFAAVGATGAEVLPFRVTATRDAYRVRLAVSAWEI